MIPAFFYDGLSSRRHPVQLLFHRGVLALTGEGVRRSVRLSRVGVSEPLEHAPRVLTLPDGGRVECSDPELARLLRKNGYREPRIVGWQRHWLRSLVSLVAAVVVLVAGYHWGLPAAADRIARALPDTVAQRIGDEQMALIDGRILQPSRLPAERQAVLRQRFGDMRRPGQGAAKYRIEFRQSNMGPNAFALANGVIVMTDELVALAPSDEAVLGVLAHELGHIEQRHALRGLVQTVGVGVVINLLIGDVSTALVAVPALLLNQKYSRDFEREADGYAIAMMQASRLPMAPMAELFSRMAAAGRGDKSDRGHAGHEHDDDEDGAGSEYLSSHPADAARIRRFRQADQSMTGLSAN